MVPTDHSPPAAESTVVAIASRFRPAIAAVACVLAAAACTSSDDRSIESEPVGASDESADSAASTTRPAPTNNADAEGGSREPGGRWTTCSRLSVDSAAAVHEPGLIETSGVAASAKHEGVLWAHNDSGSSPGVYAVGIDGSRRGFFSLDGVDAIDTEDMALIDGQIYLADIGDNGRKRSTVRFYVFDEPTPTESGDEGEAGPVATITARYPDGPTDAEAILVDPAGGELLVLSKDLDDGDAPTRIYSVPLEFDTTEPVEMTLVGSIDVGGFNSQATEFSITAVLFPGQVTAADTSTDGRIVGLRTYGTVWLFPRRSGQSMAEALTGVPCEGGTAGENQGESLTFLPPSSDADPGSVRYVTISEGTGEPINVVTVVLG